VRIEAGSTFAGYTVVKQLGRGGMATVYLVREPGIDRLVALKVLPEQLVDGAHFAARFEQEARVIGCLDHPNIIPLYRYGITDDVPWMALRYVDGGDFAVRLASHPLPLPEGLSLLRGVAAALDYAHRKGVIHRDLKPQNILLTDDGAAYLADFGVAKLLEGTIRLKTATGSVMGTPTYMAPEQAKGAQLGPFTDVYALAVICFQWLTGSLPFDADTPYAVLMKHVMEPVPPGPLGLLAPNVAAVLERGLAKEPAERFLAASTLIAQLEHALYSPATRAPPVVSAPLRRDNPLVRTAPDSGAAVEPARSNSVWKTVAAVVLACVLMMGGYIYWGNTTRVTPDLQAPASRSEPSLPVSESKRSEASSGNSGISIRLACLTDANTKTTANDYSYLPFWYPQATVDKPLCVLNQVYLTSSDVKAAGADVDEHGEPRLNLRFKPEGAQRLAVLTSANLGRDLVIVLDGKVLMTGAIRSPISDALQVTGPDLQQSQAIADRIAELLGKR
jgi:serine/threonine protein kinase